MASEPDIVEIFLNKETRELIVYCPASGHDVTNDEFPDNTFDWDKWICVCQINIDDLIKSQQGIRRTNLHSKGGEMKVYCIDLEGQGDKEIKLVSKEVFDWINSSNLGRPENCEDSGWIDQTAPQEVKDYQAKNDGKVYITIGSWGNDRALLANPLVINGIEAAFWNTKELVDFCKNQDCDIEDSFEGYIY